MMNQCEGIADGLRFPEEKLTGNKLRRHDMWQSLRNRVKHSLSTAVNPRSRIKLVIWHSVCISCFSKLESQREPRPRSLSSISILELNRYVGLNGSGKLATSSLLIQELGLIRNTSD